MKCPCCNGRKYDFKEEGNSGYFVVCRKCHGTGVIDEQTNEEWMKSLNTEELVDHLYEWRKDGSSVERQAWIEKHKERIKMQIRVWLKQPHKPFS